MRFEASIFVLLVTAGLVSGAGRTMNFSDVFEADQVNYEWEGYDGWYNNPAHPDWGGAGKVHLASTTAQLRSSLTLHVYTHSYMY